MLSSRTFWGKYKRKIFISLGVVGSGYALYKLYDYYRKRNVDLEHELEGEREIDELIKTQLQTHFEKIQRISDTTTLPYAMYYLRTRISEDLDLSHLMEQLMKGKGQSNILTSKEKLELWERLKVLSFTRTTSSLWSMTMLCLYVKVLVNILGRHLYLDIARGSEGSHSLEEADSFSRHGKQDFLATADFLSTYGIDMLIMNMENAATEVLKEKQLKDTLSMAQLHKLFLEILELFINTDGPNYWISYVVPVSATVYRELMVMSSNGSEDLSMDIRKLQQLMSEARMVLSSPDFRNIMDISLKKSIEVLIEDIGEQLGVSGSSQAVAPLAKLLSRVAHLSVPLLEEPVINKFVQALNSLPEVQLFFTLLYTNIPPPS